MSALRIIFMGTADLAAMVFKTLLAQREFQVVTVVTQPDRPKGRELKLVPTAVKEIALQHQLPVLQPERARNESFIQQLRELKPDLIIVAAYGQILPTPILDLPKFGCLNVHTSLLPKYRGAAPIQWAIWDGETVTGVTIMKMDAGMDTGDILTQETTPIAASDNGQTLHDRLATMGGELLIKTIPDYVAGKILPRKQPAEGVSHARKINKEDGKLDWGRSALNLWNQIRAFTPWPGTFTYLPDQTKARLLKIWAAEVVEQSGQPGTVLQADKQGLVVACGERALRILRLQREGGKPVDAAAFLAGSTLSAGQRLG